MRPPGLRRIFVIAFGADTRWRWGPGFRPLFFGVDCWRVRCRSRRSLMEGYKRFDFDELVDSIRPAMIAEGRRATDEEIQRVLEAFQGVRAEHEEQVRSARERGFPSWLEPLPDIKAIVRELSTVPDLPAPVALRKESIEEIADAVTSRGRLRGGAPRGARANAGGAPYKLWPKAALAEATRMWVQGEHGRSIRKITEAVTTKVSVTLTSENLTKHGWPPGRPFKFTREATVLVVAAIEAGLLEWDEGNGLGVLHQFSTGPDWLAIPRPEPLH